MVVAHAQRGFLDYNPIGCFSCIKNLKLFLIIYVFIYFRWHALIPTMQALSIVLLSLSVSAQQQHAEHRIETTTPMVFSNHNVNLNNVGLDDDQHPTVQGPKLEGPNVCTKQEA